MSHKFNISRLPKFGRGLLIAATLINVPGCLGDNESTLGSAEQSDDGSFRLALTVSGERIDTVSLTIESENLDPFVSRNRVLDVSTSTAVSAIEHGLPPGNYRVSVTSQLVDHPGSTCSGEIGGIAVVSGEIAEVTDLVLVCTLEGGDLLPAGGIEIDADVQVEEPCGSLVQELSVSPLDPLVGESAALHAVADAGVTVEWSAQIGTISPAGDSYTCPDIPGVYEVVATFTQSESCVREVRQDVRCHTDHVGQCQALPEKFAFEGTCGMRSPCHLEQDGCNWTATCRGRTVSGEGLGDGNFPFYDAYGRECLGWFIDGVWQGVCEDDGGATCGFAAVEDPDPVPFCADLPGEITGLITCGNTYNSCSVIQDGCRIQVNCDDGALISSGSVSGDNLSLWPTVDGVRYRCSGALDSAGALQGDCTERTRSGEPRTCDDFALTATPDNSGNNCTPQLPEGGFALAGCGLDGLCFAVQRGCAWQIACDDRAYSGVEDGSGQFPFTEGNQNCVARVENGEVVGSCTDPAGATCDFAPTALTPDDSCFQMPAEVSTFGCGANNWDCDVIQSACQFQAHCQGGQYALTGTVDGTGIDFPGLAGYTCYADLNDTQDRLLGACTRENADGSVSECRDITNTNGARLSIDWTAP